MSVAIHGGGVRMRALLLCESAAATNGARLASWRRAKLTFLPSSASSSSVVVERRRRASSCLRPRRRRASSSSVVVERRRRASSSSVERRRRASSSVDEHRRRHTRALQLTVDEKRAHVIDWRIVRRRCGSSRSSDACGARVRQAIDRQRANSGRRVTRMCARPSPSPSLSSSPFAHHFCFQLAAAATTMSAAEPPTAACSCRLALLNGETLELKISKTQTVSELAGIAARQCQLPPVSWRYFALAIINEK